MLTSGEQARRKELTERVRKKVSSDRYLTVRMIADELSMNNESVDDHHGRSGDEKDLCKNGIKVAE